MSDTADDLRLAIADFRDEHAGAGSASAREQERRAAASNIPDSVSYFVSPNGPTTGPRRGPAIAQASHNFMERRLPGGIPDFPFRRPRGRPMYDNAVFLPESSGSPMKRRKLVIWMRRALSGIVPHGHTYNVILLGSGLSSPLRPCPRGQLSSPGPFPSSLPA